MNSRKWATVVLVVQASNPRSSGPHDSADETLADAIESCFPMDAEFAVVWWNHVPICLNYKYDIGYMIDDLLVILGALESTSAGQLDMAWAPDTFRCDWSLRWADGILDIAATWGTVAGNVEGLLAASGSIRMPVRNFAAEWKRVLSVIVTTLQSHGYDDQAIRGMGSLLRTHEAIEASGRLYA